MPGVRQKRQEDLSKWVPDSQSYRESLALQTKQQHNTKMTTKFCKFMQRRENEWLSLLEKLQSVLLSSQQCYNSFSHWGDNVRTEAHHWLDRLRSESQTYEPHLLVNTPCPSQVPRWVTAIEPDLVLTVTEGCQNPHPCPSPKSVSTDTPMLNTLSHNSVGVWGLQEAPFSSLLVFCILYLHTYSPRTELRVLMLTTSSDAHLSGELPLHPSYTIH